MACQCRMCRTRIDGFNGKMVMLKEELWLSLTFKKDILCNECIEDIIGERIEAKHLKPNVPVNELYLRLKNSKNERRR